MLNYKIQVQYLLHYILFFAVDKVLAKTLLRLIYLRRRPVIKGLVGTRNC